jgi:hypothetical protein
MLAVLFSPINSRCSAEPSVCPRQAPGERRTTAFCVSPPEVTMHELKVYTLADLRMLPERTNEEESEYRRGYRDGFIAAANQAFDIWFLGKQRIQDRLFEHWKTKLRAWANFEDGNYLPPACVIRCVYCGKPAEHLDHVFPKSRGGTSDDSNLVPACAHCNISKHAQTPQEWRGY